MTDYATKVQTAIEFGPFALFPAQRLLEKNAAPVAISSRALDILILLVERQGELVSKQELMSHVWPNINVDDATLRTHIAGLRKSLGDSGGQHLKNIPGRGYSFVAPIKRVAEQSPSRDVERLHRDFSLLAQLNRMTQPIEAGEATMMGAVPVKCELLEAALKAQILRIQEHLDRAAGIAKTASEYATAGDVHKAIKIASSVEQLTNEVNTFIQAASLMIASAEAYQNLAPPLSRAGSFTRR